MSKKPSPKPRGKARAAALHAEIDKLTSGGGNPEKKNRARLLRANSFSAGWRRSTRSPKISDAALPAHAQAREHQSSGAA